ncbi:hypothetical protein ACFU8I_37015 [Streptomyces sp. NPDC057540]|uniref:hypothetical protein n=1 Tax=Streptomyces sp. NPDC057540 TaxID=3346160 RepID=UPI00368FFCA5
MEPENVRRLEPKNVLRNTVEESGDPDIDLIQINTPAWFGRMTLHDEETQG